MSRCPGVLGALDCTGDRGHDYGCTFVSDSGSHLEPTEVDAD